MYPLPTFVSSMESAHRHNHAAYHHGALRSTLITLALEHLAAGERIEDLSIRGLAQEAGVSKGAPRRHFPTADHLVAAVAVRGFEDLNHQLAAATDLRDLGRRYITFAVHHRQLYRAMFSFPRDELDRFPDLARAAQTAWSHLATHVAPAPDDAAVAAWSLVHGFADLAIHDLVSGERVSEMLEEVTFPGAVV